MRIRIAIDGVDISFKDFRNLILRNKKSSSSRGVGFAKKLSTPTKTQAP